MKRLCSFVCSFGLLFTLVSCASSKDMGRLRGQLNSYQSNSTGEIRALQANLRKVQDQIQGLGGQLVQVDTEQGTTAASQTAKVQALIQALAQEYQAEAEMYRRHLQRLEQAAKGFEQLSPVRITMPEEGQPFSSALSSEPR
jgi:predicted  nucleic acid-binding Zn-ribbon protein